MILKREFFFYALAAIIIFGIGIFIRAYKFTDIPPGLNQDEAGSAYESWSLAETGKDKWGNKYPAYFPSWGSGQNVLQAYLTIPAVKIFGISIFSARLVSLIFGILTLPLLFFCLLPLGRYTALTGLFLIAVVPWHFMLSRWGLESNLLPFFMLLGCTTLSRALITQQKRWIIPSLLPFALALYAYGTTILVLPFLFGIAIWLHFEKFRIQFKSWLVAIAMFLIIAFPFFLFFIENYVLESNIEWADDLFFSTPLCPSTRLSQNADSFSGTISYNINFFLSGFNDGTPYNLLQGFKLLLSFNFLLSFIGFVIVAKKIYRRKINIVTSSSGIVLSIFFAWGIASLILFFLFELNVNRFNHFFLPCIVMSAWMIKNIAGNFRANVFRLSISLLLIGFWIIESSLVINNYFTQYPESGIKENFNAGLKEAFDSANNLPLQQMLITDQMPLPYVYTLFYTQYPPEKFQKEVNVETENGTYKVNSFGKYFFHREYLDSTKEFGYLFRKSEFHEGENTNRTVVYTNEFWEVGVIER